MVTRCRTTDYPVIVVVATLRELVDAGFADTGVSCNYGAKIDCALPARDTPMTRYGRAQRIMCLGEHRSYPGSGWVWWAAAVNHDADRDGE
jgi:hypothetical protein